MFCRSLFVHFLLAIVLSVLRFTASDYLPLVPSNFSYKHQARQHINPGSKWEEPISMCVADVMT